jgi:hypothetical protein
VAVALPRELLRVLDRLAGRRAAHAVPPPCTGTHAVPPARVAAGALAAIAAPPAARAPAPPGARVHGAAAARLDPGPHAVGPPVARPLAAAVGLPGRAAALDPAPPVARPGGGARPLSAPARAARRRELRARIGAVPPIPDRAARRPGERVRGLVAVQMRRRVDWAAIDRARLHRAWVRVLAEHRVPAGEVRLLGVYGSMPLEEVAGVGVARDGERALVTLRRRRRPGPLGDLAVGRHEPSGRLLPSLVRAPGETG